MQRIGTRVVTILPDEVAREIVQLAADEGTTASEVIREIVCRAMARDPKFYTARTKRAVNGEGSIRQRTTSAEACAAVACSDDPHELVRVAFEHWDNIGWPEDKGPVSLLKRALELLSCPLAREPEKP